MSGYQLNKPTFSFGYQPKLPSLGDFQLHLDPSFEAEVNKLKRGLPSQYLRRLVLQPNWQNFDENLMKRIFSAPTLTPTPPLFTPGVGPDKPKAAAVGDLLGAIWKVPAVQIAGDQLLARVQRDFGALSGLETGLLITHGVVLGGVASNLFRHKQTRIDIYNFLIDKEVPIIGVPGLSVTVLNRGGKISHSKVPGIGAGLSAQVQVPEGGGFHGELKLNLDLDFWLPRLRNPH